MKINNWFLDKKKGLKNPLTVSKVPFFTSKWSKLGFLIKMMKILLESSQKRPLLKMGRRNPYENGLG